MTSRERVLAAIENKNPDRIPMDFGGTFMSVCLPEFLNALRKELGFSIPDDRDEDGIWVDEQIQRYFNVDLRYVPWYPTLKALKNLDINAYEEKKLENEQKKSEASDILTHAVRTHFPLRDKDHHEIRFYFEEKKYDCYQDRFIDWCIDVAKDYRKDNFATTFWVAGGPFEQGCWLRGYDQFCMDIILEPEIFEEICFQVTRLTLERIEYIIPKLAPYIDIFCFGDDLATQIAPFMSPSMYAEYIMPYHQKVYHRVKELAPSSYIFHHCCGSSYKLLPLLKEAGVSISNPTQITAVDMNVENLAQLDNLCFHGGIDLQHVLSSYEPDEIKKEVERVKSALHRRGGGYICAPCHSLPEDISVKSILAMFESNIQLNSN